MIHLCFNVLFFIVAFRLLYLINKSVLELSLLLNGVAIKVRIIQLKNNITKAALIPVSRMFLDVLLLRQC